MRMLLVYLLLIGLPGLSYSQKDSVHTEFEKGLIKDGFKVGVWEYSDAPGDMVLKVDYTSAQLLYLQRDTSTYAIREGENWTSSKLDIYPRYIGSMNEYYNIISMETMGKYPRQARINGTVGTFYIMFEIDSLGNAGNYEVFNDIGDGCADIILEALKKIPNLWLSAQKGTRRYSSRLILPVRFRIFIDERELKPRKNKRNRKDMPVTKMLPEFEINARAVNR